MEKVFYASLLAVVLVIVGGKSPKIGLSIAALVLLGAAIMNKDNLKSLLTPSTFKFSGGTSGGGGGSGGGGAF